MTPERAAELAQQQTARRMAATIGKVGRQSRTYSPPAGFSPPILDEDPDSDSDTTVWLFADGRLCWRVNGQVYRATGSTTGSDTSAVTLPADPMPQRFQNDYPATWGAAYCPLHGQELGPNVGYGTSEDHGTRRIMLGFASAVDDLDGAVIREVSLRFSNTAATADPVPISVGVHNSASPPAQFGGTRRDVSVSDWPAVGYGDEYHILSTFIGRSLQDGTIRGLTIDQPEGVQFAGTMRWDTATLRVAYTK